VGDSFAFGQGLADDRTIPVQLEQAIEASAAESVEVLNFGIEGLNVEEVRDQYADFASRWEHDLTLYLLSPNDGGPPGCNAPNALFSLYRNVYVLRVPLAVLVLAISPFSAKPDPAIVESRLIDGVRRLAAANRAHAARLGVVLLGVPMGISNAWAKRVGVPILDVSQVLSRDENRIAREGHYNQRGAAQVVAAIDDWLRRDPRWKSLALQRAPDPDSMR
jgi:hypothetical protein